MSNRRRKAPGTSPPPAADSSLPSEGAGLPDLPPVLPASADLPATPVPPEGTLPDDDLPLVEPLPPPVSPIIYGGSLGAPLAELEAALGYTFKNRTTLERAMVHRSYLHDVPDFPLGSNERLEFLGDAVLGFLVARWVYLRHPDKQEGELTALRGALVRLTRLSVWAEMIHLGSYLYLSRGEDAQGGRTRETITGRAFEALLGAIYLDGGLRGVERILRRFLQATSEQDIAAVLSRDYKSGLQRQVQARFKLPPVYRLLDTTGPAHERSFHIGVWVGDILLGTGEGRNKQQAQQLAAQAGLAHLAEWEAAAAASPPLYDEAVPPLWQPNPEVQ